MDVREAAFRRAALILSTIGATYAIVYDSKEHTSGNTEFALRRDGAIFGTLIPTKVPKKRNDLTHTGYLEALKLVAVGEAWSYEAKNKADMSDRMFSLYHSIGVTPHLLKGPAMYYS